VEQPDAFWAAKQGTTSSQAAARPSPAGSIHMPRNTPTGVLIAFFAFILGFALIWRIDWLVVIGLVGAVAVALRQFWQTDREMEIPAAEVAAFERPRMKEAA